MHHHAMSLEIQREVAGTLIPSGEKIKLQPGTSVRVTQALGYSYTLYVHGNLIRIAGKDGDALGLVVMELPDINLEQGSQEDKIWQQLRTCFDPEIPVNIVDLGLIYDCQLTPLGLDSFHVAIKMTLTAPGCGMGPVLLQEIEEKIRLIDGMTEVKAELVFDPPWDRSRMSDEAKLQLGLF